MKILGILVYLGIGMVVHVLLIGTELDWQSAATWAVIVAWPFVISAIIAAAAIIGVLIVGICVLLGGR